MSKPKQNLRYVKYRVIGWVQGALTVSNGIFLLVVIAMCLLVLGIQKLEDPYPGGLLGSSFLPGPGNRRELQMTTVRVPRKATKVRNCVEVAEVTKALEAIMKEYNKVKINSTVQVTKKAIDLKAVKKYLPAIKVIYTPKSPRPLHLKPEKITDALPRQKQPTVGPQSVPDIYRKMFHFKMTELNSTVKRIERDTPSQPCEPDQWRPVNKDKNKKVLAYSAFWDDRFDNPNVRVMVIMLTKNSPTIYCRFNMLDGTVINATGQKKIMNEHWRLKYASYFLSCPLTKNHQPPVSVSLSTDINHSQAAVLRVHQNKLLTNSPKGEIAVCVKPIHYNYDRATWLLEFLELHRMLGVEHFFLYNHTVGEHVEIVLRRYMGEGLVTVLPWDTGIKSQKEIRTEGIFSSLNDCLFRTMYLFKYVIMLDFDEYIIPRDHDTYQDLLYQLEKDNKRIRGKPGSFVFRNTFFYLYWENDTTALGTPPETPPSNLPYLLTQYKTRRLLASMKFGSRSKYIVVPDRAIEVGNHVVWKHTSGSRSINVPDSIALLHHYRICEFGGFSCLKKNSVVDHVATRFGPELLERVQNQCKETFSNGNCPVSPPLGSPW